MFRMIITTITFLLSVFSAFPQGSSQPLVGYTLKVDTADLSGYDVEMRLSKMPGTFRLAMVAHPEYDDRFWRYVKGLRVETMSGNGNILREDSALWRITITGSEVTVRYRIQLPKPKPGQRAAWRPFLSPTGGLIGGPHSFMYIVGSTMVPSIVTIKVPGNWQIATGLLPAKEISSFYAHSVAELVDCPVLIGKFNSWSFHVNGVPHHAIYWSLPGSKSIDTMMLLSSIKKIVEQAAAVFRKFPYKEYSFMIQDDAYGALEHGNSVTLGIPAADFTTDLPDYLNDIAHEYFHTWNLVRIRPVEYGDVSYTKPPLSKGLWFSEGFTMFYADLIAQRAGLPLNDTTRLKHLERLIRRYFYSPGNMHISPEKVSLAEYGPPGMLGDYSASSHLQGELIATMLDLLIRNATNGKHSMDDVMRVMMERYSGDRGFTSKDIEQIITQISGRDCRQFFLDHIYGNKPIDFNDFLKLMGMRFALSWEEGTDRAGKPAPDMRIHPIESTGENLVRIGISNPENCWGKAGLHTGDQLIKINGITLSNNDDMWQLMRKMQIGDTISLQILRPSGPMQTTVVITGYRQPVVSILPVKDATQKQEGLKQNWMKGN